MDGIEIFVIFQQAGQVQTMPTDQRGYIQFITQYQPLSGFKKIRVTTVARKYVIHVFTVHEDRRIY